MEDILLSKSQSECYLLLGKGYSTKKIAVELKISPRTVESHLNNIKNKMRLNYKNELVEKAIAAYIKTALRKMDLTT